MCKALEEDAEQVTSLPPPQFSHPRKNNDTLLIVCCKDYLKLFVKKLL